MSGCRVKIHGLGMGRGTQPCLLSAKLLHPSRLTAMWLLCSKLAATRCSNIRAVQPASHADGMPAALLPVFHPSWQDSAHKLLAGASACPLPQPGYWRQHLHAPPRIHVPDRSPG